MFKYCVWYLLKDSHPINRLIKHNAEMLGTRVFPAHITIEHSIHYREEAKTKLEQYRKGTTPVFGFSGTPYASTVNIRTEYNTAIKEYAFHAIEQPLWINDTCIPGIHVSLAYKVNGKPFSNMEVGCCIPQVHYRIEKSDIKPVVYSCHSQNPDEWTLIIS
jgi:hypothetical protein